MLAFSPGVGGRSDEGREHVTLRVLKLCSLSERGDDGTEALRFMSAACSAVGAKETVAKQMRAFVAQTGVNELMIASQVYDHEARKRSFTLAMEAWNESEPVERAASQG